MLIQLVEGADLTACLHEGEEGVEEDSVDDEEESEQDVAADDENEVGEAEEEAAAAKAAQEQAQKKKKRGQSFAGRVLSHVFGKAPKKKPRVNLDKIPEDPNLAPPENDGDAGQEQEAIDHPRNKKNVKEKKENVLLKAGAAGGAMAFGAAVLGGIGGKKAADKEADAGEQGDIDNDDEDEDDSDDEESVVSGAIFVEACVLHACKQAYTRAHMHT